MKEEKAKEEKEEREKEEREKEEREERAEGSILSRAEDGGADADDGGAVADGQGPVVGHSDGELGEVGQLGITGVQTLLEGLDAGEIGLDNSVVIGVGGHAHQAVDSDVLVGTSIGIFIKDGLDFLLGEAAFGEFGAEVKFQQDIDGPGIDRGPIINQIKQVTRIHRLDQRGIRKNQLQFVGLEMADEMPLDILRELKGLGGKLLRTVLSETALAGLIGGQNVRERMEFGNCHQFNPRWQFLFDIIKILFYHSVKDLLESKKSLLFE